MDCCSDEVIFELGARNMRERKSVVFLDTRARINKTQSEGCEQSVGCGWSGEREVGSVGTRLEFKTFPVWLDPPF